MCGDSIHHSHALVSVPDMVCPTDHGVTNLPYHLLPQQCYHNTTAACNYCPFPAIQVAYHARLQNQASSPTTGQGADQNLQMNVADWFTNTVNGPSSTSPVLSSNRTTHLQSIVT
jgi:hypothetical protein